MAKVYPTEGVQTNTDLFAFVPDFAEYSSMKRLIASLLLCVGLAPSLGVPTFAQAESDNRALYEAQCKKELSFIQADREIASDLFLLRRCITLKIAKDQQMLEAERIQQRSDQIFWRNYDFGQTILQESRRSLRDRIQKQGEIRSDYYTSVSLQERRTAVEDQRRAIRTSIRQNAQEQEVQRREELQKQQKALERCRTYSGELRYACLRGDF